MALPKAVTRAAFLAFVAVAHAADPTDVAANALIVPQVGELSTGSQGSALKTFPAVRATPATAAFATVETRLMMRPRKRIQTSLWIY